MIDRIVIFLVRRRLGLKIGEFFRFTNQKTDAVYYFTDISLVKVYKRGIKLSGVSLNWLLDPNCKIKKVG